MTVWYAIGEAIGISVVFSGTIVFLLLCGAVVIALWRFLRWAYKK
jgi:hypothetical protein